MSGTDAYPEHTHQNKSKNSKFEKVPSKHADECTERLHQELVRCTECARQELMCALMFAQKLKGTVSRALLLQVFFMNHLPLSS